MAVSTTTPRARDVAVQARTGKTWAQWYKTLDEAGAKDLDHPAIVALLHEQGVGPWWEQMVAVSYEQARGLREVHQKPEGYEITISRTLPVPVSLLYNAWNDPLKRRQWLKNSEFEIRKATLNKTLRITWVDGKTHVVAAFNAKGPGKTQVAVQHSKLADSKAATRMKMYWAAQLKNLRNYVSD